MLRCAAALGLLVIAGCALVRGSADVDAALRARELMVPVAGVRPENVPDTFDDVRDGGRRHAALDIPASRGTLVVSADDGVVLAVRESRRGGRTVYATDPDRRFVYYYAHLERYDDGLRTGKSIERGDVLGAVGTSGNADRRAPHLHFQVTIYDGDRDWRHGRPVDARAFFVHAGSVR